MKLPEGRLVRSRVVEDPRTVLVDALDRDLTGYAVFEPQDALLLDERGRGLVTFRAGVPVVAYHTGTDRAGPPALADLAAAGPYRLELFALAPADLAAVHDRPAFRVPPGMAAERLAGDPALAASTRRGAPGDRELSASDDSDETGETEPGAVEAFLDDEAKIDAIKTQAREEAKRRAEEWGFD